MLVYQLIIPIIAILIIYWAVKKFRDEKISLGLALTIITFVALMFIASTFPQISIILAKITGLGRGLDALYIIAILILMFLIFKLYNMIEDQKRRINELISQLAIYNHDDNEDDE